MSKAVIYAFNWNPVTQRRGKSVATATCEDFVGKQPTAKNLRCMYAGAQSRRKPKGRIPLIRAGPREGDGSPIAGPKPCKTWIARFPDAGIWNSTTKG